MLLNVLLINYLFVMLTINWLILVSNTDVSPYLYRCPSPVAFSLIHQVETLKSLVRQRLHAKVIQPWKGKQKSCGTKKKGRRDAMRSKYDMPPERHMQK
jgi:hypothetical protein